MGYWKDVWIQLGGGNAEAHKDEYVCAACFSDKGLQAFVEGVASEKVCSFCGAESKERTAAPLVPVLLYINKCLSGEYDAAENRLSYDRELGGYLGETWTTMDLLEEHLGHGLPNDDDGRLLEALWDGLGERVWCRTHPLSLTRDEKLRFSWDEFCELIKHRRRYFFLREEGDGELFPPPSPAEGTGRVVRTLRSHRDSAGGPFALSGEVRGSRADSSVGNGAGATACGQDDGPESDESGGNRDVLRQ